MISCLLGIIRLQLIHVNDLVSFNIEGLELDSGSSVGGSLPSPGTASCSLDGASTGTSPSCALAEHAHSPVVSPSTIVNTTQTGGPVGEPPLSQRVGVLQQRVSNQIDLGKSIFIRFAMLNDSLEV